MISTHVLDTSVGRPAVGVRVTLEYERDGAWHRAGQQVTDVDGRVRELVPPHAHPHAARHRLVFDTGAYFEARSVAAFYPEVTIVFTITDPTQHHHVPLLVSPFGYTTYRGS